MADTKAGAGTDLTDEDYAQAVFEEGGSVVINLSGVEEMKFDLIPKGIYDANIDQLEYLKSKNSGQWMFQWVIELDGGDYAGRKMYYYTSFSQKALRGTKTSLMRIDPTIFGGQFNPKAIADSGNLLGKKVRVKIGHREYNGEDQASITQIMPSDASAGGADGASANGGSFFGG